MPLSRNPEFTAAISSFIPPDDPRPTTLAVGDVILWREAINDLFDFIMSRWPDFPDVDVKQTSVQAEDGSGYKIPLYRFTKPGTDAGPPEQGATSAKGDPAVIYIRGGGYICLSVQHYLRVIKNYVSISGVQFFAMEYRSAPEHPFPTPLEDCYSALKYVASHAEVYGVDPSRLIIMGDSAGGGLCAATAILARDRKLSPPLKKQIIINGNLDDRNVVPGTHAEIADFATWSLQDNILAWTAYLGQGHEKHGDVTGVASPARVGNVKGLPDTYLDVPYLDVLRNEGVDYARRIMKEAPETDVELHVWAGVPHSFDFFAPEIDLAKRALAARVAAIKSV